MATFRFKEGDTVRIDPPPSPAVAAAIAAALRRCRQLSAHPEVPTERECPWTIAGRLEATTDVAMARDHTELQLTPWQLSDRDSRL